MNPLMLIGIALAISVSVNAGLAWAWRSAHDEATIAGKDRDEARAGAEACSNATEALQRLAASRLVDANAARAAAKKAGSARDMAADVIMSTPATVPGDDCRSATDRARAWLNARAKS